jgi:CheY-like chemotaxis protein
VTFLLPRPTVLIVEDDADQRELFCSTMRWAGFQIQPAVDGTDALRSIEIAPPDVVVLDLMLPSLDGLSVRQEIASNAATRDIPVVVVTGSDRDVPGLAASSILRKPISPDQLVAAVRDALARRRANDSDA